MLPLRAISVLRKLRACEVVGEGTRAPGFVWVRGGGAVRLGRRVMLDARAAPIELHAAPSAEIVLGDDVYVAGGTSIEAENSVHIGARCHIGAFSKIIDTHYHRLEGNRHLRPAPESVVVEEDVELGPRSVLLPRAHVGRGSVVRPATVISRRFPPEAILGGYPATSHGRSSAVDVSVVIATTGRPSITRAVSSALSQQGVRVEVYVVSESADGSDHCAGGDGDSRFTRCEKAEVLGRLRAPFVHVLNDGDVVLPGAYRALLEALAEHPEQSMSFGRVVPTDEEPALLERGRAYWRDSTRRARNAARLGRPAMLAQMLFRGAFVDSACLVRKRCVERAFDPGYLRTVRTGGCVFVERDVVQVPPDCQVPAAVQEDYRRNHGEAEFWALKVLAHAARGAI